MIYFQKICVVMHAVCAVFKVLYHAISLLYMKLLKSYSKTAKKTPRNSNFLKACHFGCTLIFSLNDVK